MNEYTIQSASAFYYTHNNTKHVEGEEPAQRGRLMTTDVVFDGLELGDDCDDLDEPMMPGSEDEFSDCDLDEDENDDKYDSDEDVNDEPTSSQPQQGTSAASSPPQ